MLAIPVVLELFTNPVTTFGDAGTLAAFGFLLAYFLITIAAPSYLAKRGELRARNVVIAVIAILCLLVPTEGSFYPVPPFPVNIFPYIFLAYMRPAAAGCSCSAAAGAASWPRSRPTWSTPSRCTSSAPAPPTSIAP